MNRQLNTIGASVECAALLVRNSGWMGDGDVERDIAAALDELDKASTAIAELMQPRKDEFVVCAAVRLPDGRIACGHRHWNCFPIAAAMGHTMRITMEMQGFMTSTGRFVSREEGMMIQLAAGIPTADPRRVTRYFEGQKLYSEDLY